MICSTPTLRLLSTYLPCSLCFNQIDSLSLCQCSKLIPTLEVLHLLFFRSGVVCPQIFSWQIHLHYLGLSSNIHLAEKAYSDHTSKELSPLLPNSNYSLSCLIFFTVFNTAWNILFFACLLSVPLLTPSRMMDRAVLLLVIFSEHEMKVAI